MRSIKIIKEKDSQKITIDTANAELVGTFYDNSSDIGVILFPGFTEHRSSLDDLSKQLSKYFKVWAFDINSQGESTGSWRLDEMQKSFYEAQKILKDYHGLKKTGMHGNSIGGMAVGIIAANSQQDLDCICLTSTPAALQDIMPYARALFKFIPQPLFRYSTILFDMMESKGNENYRLKSHAQFKTDNGYKPYAQFGALKISNIKNIIKWIETSPKLGGYASNIIQPALFVYGSEDWLLGIKNSILPENIWKMYNSIASKDKKLIIVEGADHGLNTKTRTDDCFNQDRKYNFVKEEIVSHFGKYLI